MATSILLATFALLGYIAGSITEAMHHKAKPENRLNTNYLKEVYQQHYFKRALTGLKLICGMTPTLKTQDKILSSTKYTWRAGTKLATTQAESLPANDGQPEASHAKPILTDH